MTEMKLEVIRYRIYADGNILHEDDFKEYDNAEPYCDDYATYEIPVALDEVIRDGSV